MAPRPPKSKPLKPLQNAPAPRSSPYKVLGLASPSKHRFGLSAPLSLASLASPVKQRRGNLFAQIIAASPIGKNSPAKRRGGGGFGALLSPLKMAPDRGVHLSPHLSADVVKLFRSRRGSLPVKQREGEKTNYVAVAASMLERLCSMMQQVQQHRRTVDNVTIDRAVKLQETLADLDSLISTQLKMLQNGRGIRSFADRMETMDLESTGGSSNLENTRGNPPGVGVGIGEYLILIKSFMFSAPHKLERLKMTWSTYSTGPDRDAETMADFLEGLTKIEDQVVELTKVLILPRGAEAPSAPSFVTEVLSIADADSLSGTRKIVTPRSALWEVSRLWVPRHIEHKAQLEEMQERKTMQDRVDI
ncbi:hypothetical protein T484DRAFT_1938266, partial [Baffinella frigidus]